MVLIIVAYFTVYYFNVRDHKTTTRLRDILTTSYEGILLLNAFILAYAAFRIRKIIKSLHSGFLNEKFIRLHLVNSIIYAGIYLIMSIMSSALEHLGAVAFWKIAYAM